MMKKISISTNNINKLKFLTGFYYDSFSCEGI